MSVDPAALAGGGGAALDALITAELNALAADAQALQAQVAIGDILTATVLPPNGLSDLLNVQGNRVAASLPPTLTPGDQLTVQVTGFNGPQILLQILSSDGSATASPAAVPGTISTAAPATVTIAPPATPIAPPVAAFVAASIRPNAPVPSPLAPGVIAAEPPLSATPGTIPGAAGTTLIAPSFGGIEARLAAARAAAVSVLAPAAESSAAASPPAAPAARAGSAPSPAPPSPANAASALGGGRPFVVPPQILSSRYAGPVPAAQSATAPPPAGPPPATVSAFTDPLALVRALNLPVTPSNLAAAKLALDAPQRLPAALATLESALPQSDDPRVTTLRTIAAFVAKIEPASPQLATQIAAYVDHVVTATEPALAQLLAAHAAEAARPAEPVVPAVVAEPIVAEPPAGAQLAAGPPPAPTASGPPLPVVALAQIAERAATIAVSLKEQLFSLVNGPPASGHEAEALVPAAASALTAVTSVQMAAAAAATANPQTMSFSLPMWLGSGYAQAQIAVDRDAPEGANVPLDGDNFHIAFVLDTKNLGTVAIDLRTVGRAFSLAVKTENLRTAQRFGDELSRLTDRLSSLRYQPKSVEALVATPGAASEPAIIGTVATDAPAGIAAAGFNERA